MKIAFYGALLTSAVIPSLANAVAQLRTMDQILNIVQQYVPKDARILEAGSYDGKETRELSLRWREGEVHSFEPVRDLYEQVVENVKDRKNVKTYHMALGDYIGTTKLFVSEWSYKPGVTGQSSSIIPPKEHLTLHPEVLFPRSEEVQVMTIDAWAEQEGVDRIDMMWLDVQGVGYEVLASSPKIVSTTKAILIELEYVEAYEGQKLARDVNELLTSQGFKLVGIRPWGWFADFLYIRP